MELNQTGKIVREIDFEDVKYHVTALVNFRLKLLLLFKLKRFLNVVYEGNKAEINITGMERLSEVEEKVKSFFGHNIPGAASQIQLWDQEGNQIKIWKDFNVLNDEYFEEEGLELVIQLLPSPELVPIASSRPVLNTKVIQIDGIDINTEHLKRAAGVDIYNPFGIIAYIGQLFF